MELIAQNLRLELIRPDLRGLPAPQWPPGYSVRWFRPGDACHWLRIHHDAEPFDEITPDVFLREFGSDFSRLGERQCFLQDPNDRVIGTGTAWEYTDSYAYRLPAYNTGNGGSFVLAEWVHGGIGALDGPDDATRDALLLANTTPGTHVFDPCIPEPASVGLLLIAAVGLVGFNRRRSA